MRRPVLTALLLAASLPVAAESLNYNIVEFSESANMEVPRDTMTAHSASTQKVKTVKPSTRPS